MTKPHSLLKLFNEHNNFYTLLVLSLRIVVSQETEKGSKVISEESLRRIARHRHANSHLRRKPFGEVHLKVSSIRESRSDDKRFSIFTGTKRLHLRAETREDRVAWMEALQAVKDMFPRISSSELMAPTDNVVVSTERLRQRLSEEGVSEAVIQDSEQIMRSEFATLQNQLLLLKQKQWLLTDTLRQLEVKLETAYKASGGRKVNIISHSMGGLLVSCFVSLHSDVFSKYVNKWICIACPFQGASGCINDTLLTGLQFVEGFESNFFVSRWTMHQLLVECPSIYEMLPNPGFKWTVQPQIQVWHKQSKDNSVILESYGPTESIALFEEALRLNEDPIFCKWEEGNYEERRTN